MHMQRLMKWLQRLYMVLHIAKCHSAMCVLGARHASYSKGSASQNFKTQPLIDAANGLLQAAQESMTDIAGTPKGLAAAIFTGVQD